MSKNLSKLEETLESLMDLSHQEQSERELISKAIHFQAGGVAALKIWLDLLETCEIKERKSIIKNLNSGVQKCIDGLRTVMEEAYPREVVRNGLIYCLLKRCDEFERLHNSRINFITKVTERLKINSSQEVGIYQFCFAALEHFCLASAKEIELSLTRKGRLLTIQVAANEIQNAPEGPELFKKMSYIKAKAFLFQGNLSTRSGKENIIKADFTLNA